MNFKKEELLKDQGNPRYMMIFPALNDIYDEFSYLDLTKEKFLKIVMKSLSDKNLSPKSADFTSEIYTIAKEEFSKIALENKDSREKLLQIITKYINSLQSSDDYETLNKIAQFIDKKTSETDIDFLLDLINENKKLNDSLKNVANNKEESIEKDYLQNSTLNNLIEAYHVINNEQIEIDNYENFDLSINDDNVRAYLNEIGRINLLTEKEEYDCIVAMKNGSKKAKETLVESNLRLVVSIAKRYKNNDMSLLDLVQEGNIALMKAADLFDLSKKCRFSTYATYWIKQHILRYIGNKARIIRLPIHINEMVIRLNRVEKELKDELKKEPTLEEIAERMGMPLNKVSHVYNISRNTLSLNKEIDYDDDGKETMTLFSDEKSELFVDEIINSEVIKELFVNSNLNQREIEIIKMRYGIGYSHCMKLQEIGDKFGVTRERIRQQEESILRKLRRAAINSERIVEKRNEQKKASNKKVEFKPIVLYGIQQTIYEIFSNYKIEEINEALENLSENEMKLIKIRFGDNLFQRVEKIVWPNAVARNKYNSKVIKKLQISLYNIRKRNTNQTKHSMTRKRKESDQ